MGDVGGEYSPAPVSSTRNTLLGDQRGKPGAGGRVTVAAAEETSDSRTSLLPFDLREGAATNSCLPEDLC